ncbi:MAG: penicillin-binding protein 2 [Anaerolineae bacterium]
MGQPPRNLRLLLLRGLVILASVAVVAQTGLLQFVSGESYRLQADRNRFRLVSVAAPRGVIYDRHGELLVRNSPRFVISVVPADLPEGAATTVLPQLAAHVDGEAVESVESTAPVPGLLDRLLDIVEAGQIDPFTPVLLPGHVPREVALTIEARSFRLPGVAVRAEPRRSYLNGSLTTAVLGYTGPIPPDRLSEYLDDDDAGYSLLDHVGLTGVEMTYETVLRGRPGAEHVEVDAQGRQIRTVGPRAEPTPGGSLILTVDLSLTRVVTERLQAGMDAAGSPSGAVVAMDPRTGEILALVSLPTYDANVLEDIFWGDASPETYRDLDEDPNLPLVNRAITGQYPPGSTFKVIVAAAALEEGVVTPSTRIHCPGIISIPDRYFPEDPERAQPFFDWLPSGHGSVRLIRGIAESCDIYFYLLAGGLQDPLGGEEFAGLGHIRLASYARLFGIGSLTQIELPGEAPGLIPDAEWKRRTWGEPWVTGDTYNAAIGQGFILATPLQVLNYTAAVANGGTLFQPRIVREVVDSEGRILQAFISQPLRRLPIAPQNLAAVREGMRSAVERGTGLRAQLAGLEVAGKTGSAEYPGPPDEEGNLPTHAWFTAFAPAADPEIAIVAFLEGGGEGGQHAATVAAEILAYYFSAPASEETDG